MASVQVAERTSASSMPETDEPPPSRSSWGGWGTAAPTAPVLALSDIMSEQLASSLQSQEEERFVAGLLDSPSADVEEGDYSFDGKEEGVGRSIFATSKEDTSSDFMIAQMLQIQFSREHDDDLKRVEQKYNGTSKVSVSLNKYLMSPPGVDSDEDEEDLPPPKSWDSFEAHEKAFPQMPRCGYVKVNNELVTKHDVTMNGRRNACRVMESMPPHIHTGDAGSFDMQLSNKVFNKLRAYSKAEENRRSRHHDKKEKSTSDLAIDTKTRLLLYKLINATILENVCGIISTGKEAVVLFASGGSGEEVSQLGRDGEATTKMEIPTECAVKVFKTSLNEFKTRDKYIRDDYRFKDRFSKQNPRKVIHLWAEKEMHNLVRISKAGIPCPAVVVLKKHILVLSFIGSDSKPAPKLKDVKFPIGGDEDDLLLSAYNQTVDMMIRLYKQCNLVHADLSEYNILWHENKCYVIDVSQSVEPSHPNALEFLYRDCFNIANFFTKRGIKNCHTPESLFRQVCDLTLDAGGGGAEIINQIQDYEKNLELLTFAQPEKPFAFDYCWEQSTKSSPPSKQSDQLLH
ncbi:serine/threonine-protein kinase RIO3 [Folsomia candida]|uniref:serine/threonine-protein kinase RIO3 n=1 Tax=Folsomia candida TaxID=158441 RepID=UPI000B9043F8|nr:serine/threonine-protein kinase RIO3 [Folsomia candida]